MTPLFETQPELPGMTGSPEPAAPAWGYARVALEQGIDTSPTGLTYAVPESLADLRVGERVLVPLGKGNKKVAGYVVGLTRGEAGAADIPAARRAQLKLVAGRDPKGVSLPVDLIDLARWMAGYYCCPLGMVFATMLPAAVKRGTGTVKRQLVRLAGVPENHEDTKEARRHEEEKRAEQREKSAPASVAGAKPGTRDAKLDTAEELPLPPGVKLSKLQRQVLQTARWFVHRGEPWVELKHLADEAGARSIAPVKQLLQKGLLESRWISTVRAAAATDPSLRLPREAAPELVLSPAQEKAVTHLGESIAEGFSVHLLHGVTGSGKTEVYLRVIEEVLQQSKVQGAKSKVAERNPPSVAAPANLVPCTLDLGPEPPGAIVLVPEIALTPQTVARFLSRFDRVAVLHSGLTAAQRHEEWRRIRDGEAQIVIGARSAIFAPLPNLRIIIVDEEHEPSYKQDQLPRYHARDVAVKRAQLLDIPILLGSATPSLESYYNATVPSGYKVQGAKYKVEPTGAAAPAPNLVPCALDPVPKDAKPRYHLLELPDRVAGVTLPKVDIVDMTQERRKRYEMTGAAGVNLLSLRLEIELRRTLEQKGQAILLLNRRGYANYIACPDQRCGWILRCDYCDVSMVYHKDGALPTGGLVRCHHCEAEQMLPAQCPVCGRKTSVFGLGTQRVEEEIARKFPDARMARMDSDTMRTAKDYHDTLERFGKGELDVLLGTQMIAKGLDFPNVRLVGVISADSVLHMPDYRASERTFQLIAQVAGRAGRGEHAGLVILQTLNPNDPAINLASRHDYPTFAAQELSTRATVGLPPVGRMARIVVRDEDHLKCAQQAHQLAEHLHQFNAQLGNAVRVRGPAPCAIARIAGYHRHQIELLAPDAVSLQRLLAALRNARLLKSDARTAIDVDPVSLL